MFNSSRRLHFPDAVRPMSQPNESAAKPVSDSDLKSKTVRGGTLTVLTQAVNLVVQVAGTIVVARLLTPRDFGLVAIALTFGTLLANLGTTGFTEAIVQSKTISQAQLSTLFWINIAASTLMAVLFILAAPLVAAFYREPDVQIICVGVGATIFLGCLSSQHLAMLKRDMKFPAINAVTLSGRCVSVTVTIVTALLGWGYWSLVFGICVLYTVEGIGSWIVNPWRPGLPSRDAEIRPMIRYTLNQLGYYACNYAGRNFDNFLMGWCLGSFALGSYKKAYDLFALPASQISVPLTTVTLAGLSRVRDEPEKFRKNYLKAVSLVAMIGMGLSAVMFVAGYDLLLLVLGPKWVEAGRIFIRFSPGIGLMLVYNTNWWLHLSLGTTNRLFRWGLVELLVLAVAFLTGLRYGAFGIAVAWSISFAIILWPCLAYAGRPIGLRFSSVLKVIWPFAIAALVAGTLGWLLLNVFPLTATPLQHMFRSGRIFFCLSVTSVAYFAVLLLFPREKTFGPLLEYLRLHLKQKLKD